MKLNTLHSKQATAPQKEDVQMQGDDEDDDQIVDDDRIDKIFIIDH